MSRNSIHTLLALLAVLQAILTLLATRIGAIRSTIPPPFHSDIEHKTYSTDNVIPTYPAETNVTLNVTTTRRPPDLCQVAQIRCALRKGCGRALKVYMLDCADLLSGKTESCDTYCKASLIAVVSTEEGEALLRCRCENDVCHQTRQRLQVCRAEVLLARSRGAVVPCRIAQLICLADASCSTALSFYDKLCPRMFSGRECSPRCNNSIAVLGRQPKSSKLASCECDGTEPFACQTIKGNMKHLCFPEPEVELKDSEEEEGGNSLEDDPSQGKTNETISGGCDRSIISIRIGDLLFIVVVGVMWNAAAGWVR